MVASLFSLLFLPLLAGAQNDTWVLRMDISRYTPALLDFEHVKDSQMLASLRLKSAGSFDFSLC